MFKDSIEIQIEAF